MYFTKLHRLFADIYIVNMTKKYVTSLEFRKLIVMLRNEDKLSIRHISRLWWWG